MMTAYSKEKLKTILMQNFGGKHRVFHDVKIMVNKSFECFFRESRNENFKRISVHEAETGC